MCLVRVLSAGVYVQLAQLLAAQGVTADHSLDGFLHHAFGMLAIKDGAGGAAFGMPVGTGGVFWAGAADPGGFGTGALGAGVCAADA